MDDSRRSKMKANSSLLLAPSASGFTLNQMAGNSLLMPVSQQEVESLVTDSGEVDSFVGQSSNINSAKTTATEPSTCTFFSQSKQEDLFLASLSHPLPSQNLQNKEPSNPSSTNSDSQIQIGPRISPASFIPTAVSSLASSTQNFLGATFGYNQKNTQPKCAPPVSSAVGAEWQQPAANTTLSPILNVSVADIRSADSDISQITSNSVDSQIDLNQSSDVLFLAPQQTSNQSSLTNAFNISSQSKDLLSSSDDSQNVVSSYQSAFVPFRNMPQAVNVQPSSTSFTGGIVTNDAVSAPSQFSGSDDKSSGPSVLASGPPPVGPVHNFRRTSGMSYLPPPGLNISAHTSPSSVIYDKNTSSSPVQFTSAVVQDVNIKENYLSTFVPLSDDILHSNDEPLAKQPSFIHPSPGSVAVSDRLPATNYETQQSQASHLCSVASTLPVNCYQPVTQHWFYCKKVEGKQVWFPFSLIDSLSLEEAYIMGQDIVATDGGRYDVSLCTQIRYPVYWKEVEPCVVRRCSWFYKSHGERFVPYEEYHSQTLEEAYKMAVTSNTWGKRIQVGDNLVIMHNPNVIVHVQPNKDMDEWGGLNEIPVRPKVVRRGINEFDNIEDGEPVQIDHLVFVVHGIGAVCDLKFRDVIECVDDFRSISLSMMQSHFSNAQAEGTCGRVEFIPVKWHGTLHGDATGIDRRMSKITLESIPKLRYLTNDTILDVLYYTSPAYCQVIIDTVCSEINRLHKIFNNRNPHFRGEVSLVGHSLGTLILFDVLLNQKGNVNPNFTSVDKKESFDESAVPVSTKSATHINDVSNLFEHLSIQEYLPLFEKEKIDFDTLKLLTDDDLQKMNLPYGPRKKILSFYEQQTADAKPDEMDDTDRKRSNIVECNSDPNSITTSVVYLTSQKGTGHPCINYPRFNFGISCFFALGSPVPMFLTVRGIDVNLEDFKLPTCPSYFNIYHPYDPVAYRMEPLINPNLKLNPVTIPHHKGRKRLHLELRDSLSKVGSDLKQKLIESLRSTWNSVSEFARFHKSEMTQEDMEKVVEDELNRQQESELDASDFDENVSIGQLNGGRRIDYVLQEKPIESLNQYLFALASHACYWESEDTLLFILKEIYALKGIKANVEQPKSEQKLQLFNPAAVSAHRPVEYMPAPFCNAEFDDKKQALLPTATSEFQKASTPVSQTVTHPYQQVNSSCTPTITSNSQSVSPPQNFGPPPLAGFIRSQQSPLRRLGGFSGMNQL